jgi:hypothetical protein
VAEPVFAEWLLLPQEVTDELGRSLGIAYFPLGYLGHVGGLLVTRVLGQMPELEYTLVIFKSAASTVTRLCTPSQVLRKVAIFSAT